jgi:uncharacterized tellurite resistance protein B-like protein
MGILQWLKGSETAQEATAGAGNTDTVRKIVGELEAMVPERARFVAAFAYILGRVAHADQHFSDDETAAMEKIVHGFGDLPEEQAVLVVQIAKSQNRLFGGTENFLVTREFREISSSAERRQLLDCMFAVSAADDSISSAEESQIRQIASELGFTHREFVQARLAYSDRREVMRAFRENR